MKAIVLTGIREMDLREVPVPCVAQPTDVRVRAVGVGSGAGAKRLIS